MSEELLSVVNTSPLRQKWFTISLSFEHFNDWNNCHHHIRVLSKKWPEQTKLIYCPFMSCRVWEKMSLTHPLLTADVQNVFWCHNKHPFNCPSVCLGSDSLNFFDMWISLSFNSFSFKRWCKIYFRNTTLNNLIILTVKGETKVFI